MAFDNTSTPPVNTGADKIDLTRVPWAINIAHANAGTEVVKAGVAGRRIVITKFLHMGSASQLTCTLKSDTTIVFDPNSMVGRSNIHKDVNITCEDGEDLNMANVYGFNMNFYFEGYTIAA